MRNFDLNQLEVLVDELSLESPEFKQDLASIVSVIDSLESFNEYQYLDIKVRQYICMIVMLRLNPIDKFLTVCKYH